MPYKRIIEGLKLLKEDCMSVTCQECIFSKHKDVCILNVQPFAYDLKEVSKRVKHFRKIQKIIATD